MRHPPSAADPFRLGYRRGTADALIGEPLAMDAYTEVYGSAVAGELLKTTMHYGQSNQANFMVDLHSPTSPNCHMLNVFSGAMYRAQEPIVGCNGGLPGGSNPYGCCLSRLGDKLIAAGWCTRHIIACCAAGGTNSNQWANGDCTQRLRVTARRLLTRDLPPAAVVRHLGESDQTQGFSAAQVEDNIHTEVDVLRSEGIACPIIVCIVARSSTAAVGSAAYLAVRAGQNAAVDPSRGIYLGFDTDTIGSGGRHDDLHWNASGADTFMTGLTTNITTIAP